MKSAEEIMEILEAYDLTGSLRDAAELAGCSHHTVAQYVAAREHGELTPEHAQRREMVVDPYREKLEEWVDRSHGKVRADVAHEKLTALGYTGSERTTRRAVAEAKAVYRAGRRRVHRPWVPEPGMWFQYDFAMVRASMVLVRNYFAPGWHGAGLGWFWHCSIRRCRQ